MQETTSAGSSAAVDPGKAPAAPAALFPPRLILVPLDFSARARKALRYAEAFARHFGARLQLLHVTEPVAYPTDFGYAPVPTGELEAGFQETARQELNRVIDELKSQGIPADATVRIGRPYHEIAEGAASLGADLVVVTTHGYTGLKHALLGSTAERVVRHAPCPVLVVRDQEREFVPGAEAPAAPAPLAPGAAVAIGRLLIPVDFSEASRQALEYASWLAAPFGARICFVHVLELPYADGSLGEIDTRALENDLRTTAQEELNKLLQTARSAGLQAEGRLLAGRPWHEIVEAARSESADLIVMGTRGLAGLKHMLMGSTAERVVRHAPCPVLVVRPLGKAAR